MENNNIDLLQLSLNYILSQSIFVAAEIKLHKLLMSPKTAIEIASATNCNVKVLERVLNVLFAHKIIARNEGGQYIATECLNQLELISPVFIGKTSFNVFSHTLDSVKTGQPAWEAVFGHNFYDTLNQKKDWSAEFNHWNEITGHAWLTQLVEAYDFSIYKIIVDLGGGHGVFLSFLQKQHPNLKGIIFDRPDCQEQAIKNIEKNNIANRCSFQSGDFLKSIPQKGDAYCFSRVLLNFSDEMINHIFQICQRDMPPTAKLIIIDALMPPENHPTFPFAAMNHLHLFMLMGGARRTKKEWEKLLGQNGFKINQFLSDVGGFGLFLLEG
ncbi:hydroxyneurosporene-O-methyltransferase, partial [Candidatus Magnetomorum sp. HK-1]